MIAFVYINEECFRLPLEPGADITIGSSKRDTLMLSEPGLEDAHFRFRAGEDGVLLAAKGNVFSNGSLVGQAYVSLGDVFTFGGMSVYICPKQGDYESSVRLSTDREYRVGRSRECAFCLSDKRVSSRHARIYFEDGGYKLADLESKNHTFVNGKKISVHSLSDGDVISIACYEIVYEDGSLSFFNTGDDMTVNTDEKDRVRRYPMIRRSPRLETAAETKRIEIQAPPDTGEKPSINWLVVFLPPLVMAGITVLSVFLSEGSLTTLFFVLPMTLVTLMTTVISYFSQVRGFRRNKKKKTENYDGYVSRVMGEIEAAYQSQLMSANRANPETRHCLDIVMNRMRRLWERSAGDGDFLEIRLGSGTLPLSVEVVFPKTAPGEDMNPQIQRMREQSAPFCNVRDIAVTLPVKGAGTIGIIGNRQIAVKAMKNIIVQLVTNHSYADVRLVILSEEHNYAQWAWARWLPHIWNDSRQVRFLSSDRKQALELLNYFEDVLKKRRNAVSRAGEQKGMILPYLIFVVTDDSLAENREFLKLVSTADAEVGSSAFLLFDSLGKLPKDCGWFVELSQSGGRVYAKGDSTNRTAFTLDVFEEYERFARAMAPLRDRSVAGNSRLPARITFFQGYGLTEAGELDILRRWGAAKPYESLAVPIGIQENGKTFLFDIHEKHHGPHGLVAGTTGAGKSEVLQTYILSMCVNFSPEDVSFLLIDFKGTGLVGSLKSLPHIAGVISNIDGDIQRNLISLEAEIDRRTRLFDKVSGEGKKIQDIYEYQREFHSGNLKEALAHLIVIIDEFTELKTKFPDFMQAVDRASRVGRTLGIHLILATQKPGGSVSDEIRANTNFKWCLRVKEGESREVLGRPEAESIPQEYPGRAYVQVGNNELFELVQMFYSGAEIERGEDSAAVVSFVDASGRRETIGIRAKSGTAGGEKELAALVRHIVKVHGESGLPSAGKVWENALPVHLSLLGIPWREKESEKGKGKEPEKKPGLCAVVGLADDPRRQSQYSCEIDFSSNGHLLIYGAPGTGKTMLLQTILMSLAGRYTPDEVHMYVMDFGSWSMKNLEELPHVGGVANGNETEKISGLAKLLDESLTRRKTLFAGIGAGSLAAYRQVSSRKMPSIVVAVDNFAPVRELFPEVEDMFVRLSREGGNYGIFLAVTVGAVSGSIGYNLTQNFKQALSLWMTEKADYRDIVGDTGGLEPARAPGRGLVRGRPPLEFQTALAVEAADDAEYVLRLKQLCREYAREWKGDLPRGIPVMPDIVLPCHVESALPDGIAIGLSADEMAPVVVPWETRTMLISGMEGSGKSNMLRVIAGQLAGKMEVVSVDPEGSEDAAGQIADALQMAMEGGEVALIIDNFPQWLSHADYDVLVRLEELVGNTKKNAFSLFVAGDAVELVQSGGGVISAMIRSGVSILLGGSFQEHSSQFEANNIGYQKQGEQLPACYGYLIRKKKAVLFKALFGGYGVGGREPVKTEKPE